MSIWGRRVDAWVSTRQRSHAEQNRRGLNALWQIALVVLVIVAVAGIEQRF